MAKQITTTVVLQGRDLLSPVVEKAAAKSVRSIDTIQKKANALASGSFGLMRATAGIGTAISAPLIYAGKQAVDFEHQLAQLGKVANMDLGSKGLTQLGEQAKDVAPYLATLPGDILKSMTALKQSGIPIDQLKDVAKFVGEAGVAFDVTAGQAGAAFGTIKSGLGATIQETKAAFDVINTLSNQMNATPERLISFFTSGGAGVANALKLQANDIAAYGATLIAAGKSGEEAATIMERVTKNIFTKATLTNVFDKAGGGKEGLLSVFSTGAAIKDEKLKRKYFALFGEYGLDVRRLADNMNGPGGLRSAIGLVADETKYGGAVNREFSSQMKSTLNQLKRLWTDLQVTLINFGTQALPVIKSLAEDLKPVITNIGDWVKANPDLTASLIKGAAGLAVFSFAVSGVSAVVGAVAKVVGGFSTVLGWFQTGGALAPVLKGLGALASSMWAVVGPALVVAAPYLAGAAAIAAIGYAAYKAYDYFESFHKIVTWVTTSIQTLIDKSGELFLAWAAGDYGKMWSIVKTGAKQTKLNVDSEMDDWRKTHQDRRLGPILDDKRIKEIEDRRKVPTTGPDWLKNVEYNRKLRKDAEMRKLLNPQNLPGKPYYEPDPKKLQPRPVNQAPPAPKKPFEWTNPFNLPEDKPAPAPGPAYNPLQREKPMLPVQNTRAPMSISVTSNPVFNIQGPVTPEMRKDLTGLLDQNAQNIREQIEKAQRSKHRTSFDPAAP